VAQGQTTTSVPLIDGEGSTVGLVNAANVDAGPATTYTYDPAGNPTVSGTANDWPFQYQGMEKEFTDPGPYYYTGGGQFYSAQLVRSLSEVGQTSSQGSGGSGGFSPSGMAIAPPSVSTGGLSGQSVLNDSQQALQVGTDIYVGANALGLALFSPEWTIPLAVPLAIIGGAIDFLVKFFEDLFGGGSTPEIPRQLRHKRHPLYPVILGFPDGLIPDEASKGKAEFCGDPQPRPNARPLESPEYMGSSDLSGLSPFNPNQGPVCTEARPPCNPYVPYFAGKVGAAGGLLLGISLRLTEMPQLAAPAGAVGATLGVLGYVAMAACQGE
jgi:hypothetical protein